MSKPEGVALIRRLLEKSDVLIENFKVGGLAKFGLAYEDLKADFPALVYCSITGYGQTGPYAQRPGYDMMAQGMGGLISMRSEEHTSELQSLMRISYAVFCLKKKKKKNNKNKKRKDLIILETNN